MKITIIGAGMAGLVAANMLRRHEVTIMERAPTLPNNHTALLRFRSLAVSDATGIPFTLAMVRKGLWDGKRVVNEPTLAHINRYSHSVTGGELHDRSVLNLQPVQRWIAPRDFIQLMARNLDIRFNQEWVLTSKVTNPIISCMPMYMLMGIVNYPNWRDRLEFKYLPVWTIKAQMRYPISTICQTLYNTERGEWYRATIHGQEVTLEFMEEPVGKATGNLVIAAVLRFFNETENWTHRNIELASVSKNMISIGKIMPIDDQVRKSFMLHMSEKYNIYSLGRFATWRNILLDDVVNDVKKIEAMIEAGHSYEARKEVV